MIMKEGYKFLRTGKKECMIKETLSLELQFSNLTSLIAEKSRAIMLWMLMDGKAYTATELAIGANISAQAASNHLSKLIASKLLIAASQGRHKYYRFANEKVAHTIETIAGLLPMIADVEKSNPVVHGIKHARTCYDHLAGKTGVLITKALLNKKILLDKKNSYSVSSAGIKWFAALEIEVAAVQKTKRKFAYPCLDWSERKHHLAGALGTALLNAFITNDWIRKVKQSRELIITGTGRREFSKKLGIEL